MKAYPNIHNHFICGNKVIWNTEHFQIKDLTEEDSVSKSLPLSCSQCFQRNFSTLHEPRGLCRVWPGEIDEHLEVVFMILSGAEDYQGRSRLRKSWVSVTFANQDARFRHVFVLGAASSTEIQQKIQEEQLHHGDILQKNSPEGYHNIIIKTLEGLEWVLQQCSRARYVMKLDSDSFVNINILTSLISNITMDSVLFGYCRSDDPPMRDPKHRHFLSVKSYSPAVCPPYCYGGGYVLSMNTVAEVLRLAPDVPQISVEDVFVGWCLRESRFRGNNKYRVLGVSNFMLEPEENFCDHGCRCMNNVVVWHNSSDQFLQCAWNECYRDMCNLPRNDTVCPGTTPAKSWKQSSWSNSISTSTCIPNKDISLPY